jgi:hypothetical protein
MQLKVHLSYSLGNSSSIVSAVIFAKQKTSDARGLNNCCLDFGFDSYPRQGLFTAISVNVNWLRESSLKLSPLSETSQLIGPGQGCPLSVFGLSNSSLIVSAVISVVVRESHSICHSPLSFCLKITSLSSYFTLDDFFDFLIISLSCVTCPSFLSFSLYLFFHIGRFLEILNFVLTISGLTSLTNLPNQST